ncbi:class I SAM-dependent methyltransferase [Mycobacterium uberis]|uniref:class I SAM-dependent methyltransferase n=1 Tax=Mycobacterium uberis TaxID=2162698 RepID=UPI001FB1B23F|nr:class I SAM-dependent methyltransferase [Mycobacterium uberis]
MDQPQVIEFKSARLSALAVAPAACRRTASVDLREDRRTSLHRSGFHDTKPTS